MRRRVVVTGIGCVTPVGNDVDQMWASLRRCGNGVGPITHFPADDFPTQFAAEVKDYSIDDYVDDPDQFTFASPNILFAIGAASQAMADSGLGDGDVAPPRFGVYLGAGEGGQDFQKYMSVIARSESSDEDKVVDVEKFIRYGMETLESQAELEQEPNRPAGHLASLFNAQGPNMNCLTACAASSQAIGEATELIRRGDVDVMLSGGAHSMIHPFGVTGFSLLTALSTHNDDPARASRPFDLNRDGFVLGEGSGMLVLEELEHARSRGAHIHGEVLGYGSTADAYRITDIHPEGRGATACIQMAMRDAEINTDDLQYINAHGTSTKVNDKVETLAIRNTLGADAESTPVSSIKSMMGHLIAAAGSVEAITCLLAIRDNVLPPTRNYETADPDCDLDYVPNEAREAPVRRALSNSFGFGGQNISLVLSEFTG
ncbi:MAG TPA: beta-ketoacyl-[acyl-carrier-protein] synthase II [Planctomycetaceae bacterium]|jgi:3-oxoacyl-[acyl-carrier-protein] synthase II|nr:beta-ketoacyl-[acyl-carrier-protein] synthase II [Planctomycetaceae bacterium]MCH2588369.1 beta-ketoacyl-[acyl-carrier-protein] synthase family protein [Planctomycetales bacterium]GIS60626.1 MAG: 3-oxoacyl-[acyl-carrier-protein] synthase 2 [Planctomycetaceae bacterium]HAA63185.1 beta-ketoacyl-[acyl-carrier-protein] synthase II [Planctomycetaceae bacterium]|tara:strand:+ start:6255 stop:7547 length:1293 start_codon:yes stop_codon:yes gene_type:complete